VNRVTQDGDAVGEQTADGLNEGEPEVQQECDAQPPGVAAVRVLVSRSHGTTFSKEAGNSTIINSVNELALNRETQR
jgi:hypothetical protein